MYIYIDAYEFSNCGQFYLPPDASPPRCAQTWFSPGAPPKPDNDNKETAVSQCNSGKPSGNTVFWQQGGPVFLHVHTKVQVMLVIRWAMPVTLCGEEQRLLLPRIQSSSQQLLSDQGHLNWSRHHMPSKIPFFPRMLNGFIKKINLAFQVGPTIQEQEESLGSPWL